MRDASGVTRPLGSIDPRLYKLTDADDDDDYEPPDNHIGRVWFSVKYEAQSEKLLVSLVKARNLASHVSAVYTSSTSSSPATSAGDFFVRSDTLPVSIITYRTAPHRKSERNSYAKNPQATPARRSITSLVSS